MKARSWNHTYHAEHGNTATLPLKECAHPGRHSKACGCCKAWNHCSTCNCYASGIGAEGKFAHIPERDVEEGIRADLELRERR